MQPDQWEVRQYPPITAAPVTPWLQPTQVAASSTTPQPAPIDWAAVQAYTERTSPPSAPNPSVPEPTTPAAPSPEAPASYSGDWTPMRPSSLPQISPWQGLQIANKGRAQAMLPYASRELTRFPWLWVMTVVIVLALLGALAVGQRHDAPIAHVSVKPTATVEQRKASTIATPRPKECTLSPGESEDILKPLLDQLFAAKNDQERLACIAFASRHVDQVKTFFAGQETIQLKSLSAIAAPVHCLPATSAQTLFEMTTSYNARGSALVRLMTGQNNKLALDWDLLNDSLMGSFADYQTKPESPPRWISVGMRRSFGFSESPEVREGYHAFDIQGYGNGADKTTVLLAKLSPTGRSMDQRLQWGGLYVARVLLAWLPVNGQSRLTIINAIVDAGDAGM